MLCVGGKSGLIRGCPSGEASDRATLRLPGVQEELVATVAAAGKPIVLVVLDGRPLALADAIKKADAAILTFPPGEEGGTAIAEVLTGRINPPVACRSRCLATRARCRSTTRISPPGSAANSGATTPT